MHTDDSLETNEEGEQSPTRLGKKKTRKLADIDQTVVLTGLAETLKQVSEFASKKIREDNEFFEVAKVLALKVIDHNQLIFDRGSRADKIYVVLAGAVEIHSLQVIQVDPNILKARQDQANQIQESIESLSARIKKCEDRLQQFEQIKKFLINTFDSENEAEVQDQSDQSKVSTPRGETR